MVFTRIFFGPSSAARTRVTASTAPLVDEYTTVFGIDAKLATELTLMMLHATGSEVFKRFMCREDGAEHVDVELTMKFVFGQRFEGLERVDPSIIDENVQRAESLLRLSENRFDVISFRDVSLTAIALPPCR